jgi:hypothetical protein
VLFILLLKHSPQFRFLFSLVELGLWGRGSSREMSDELGVFGFGLVSVQGHAMRSRKNRSCATWDKCREKESMCKGPS